ncbi:hypothetical protein QYE76_023852 [Lolium multiflorum]|uniref:Uncharacterized protein n=1 Tax=Lolium multiflorum TaxID=4521 RepID=A0AAD8VV57_LOLMU|nr:hypothetical protein QYE76_023852 [Lolium multiflorum]
MVRKLKKSSPGGFEYLLVAIDKFSKWIEAKPGSGSTLHLWLIRNPMVNQIYSFFLVYGSEAVLPSDIIHDSPRVFAYNEETADEARQLSVDLIEEARNLADQRSAIYQQKLRRYHSRRVRNRSFMTGDLVLRLRQVKDHKLQSPWEGPFVISKVLHNGSYYLVDFRELKDRPANCLCRFAFRFFSRRRNNIFIFIIIGSFCRRSCTVLRLVLRAGPRDLALVAGSDRSRLCFSPLGVFRLEELVRWQLIRLKRLNFSSRNLLDSAAGGTFMSITLGAATKLLDDMMINYSEWHTERAPQGKKVNSVEETSSLSDKIDVIMSMLVNGRSNVDPNNVPLASLVVQEENVDVNFIKSNNFNNHAYRNNFGNNYRPYPSSNGNGYGNSYGNSYNNNRSVPSGLDSMLKEFISTQTAFNKSVEEKLGKIDILASKVDSLAADVDLLKLKVMPNEDKDIKSFATANAIQVRINENIRLMAELHARWEREENEKLAKENNVAKVWTITTTSNVDASHVATPPTINGKIIGVGNVSTPSAKRTKLPETAETACDKTAEIFQNIGDNDPIAVDHNGLDFDDCHISEVIKFLQKLAKSPNASAINLAFTKHITNALIKAREDKLKLETSIPRKLEDGWEPIIKMRVNDFDCNALCDLGASISVMPKKIYDMLDLPPLKNCYLDVNLADNAIKKPLGRIDNVRIMVNNNLVPVDFVVLDIECNASCPIILGRPFLRTVGATIDMKEGNIKYQFPLKKGMEHFPRKRMKLPYDSIIRTNYDVDASSLDNT